MTEYNRKARFLCLLYLAATFIGSLTLTTVHLGLANAQQQNNTLVQAQGTQSMGTTTTNATNIVLVHGGWADGSGWSKEIPILTAAGHKVIAVQLPLHSLR